MTSRLVALWVAPILMLGGCGTMRSVEPQESAPVVTPSAPQPAARVVTPSAPQPAARVVTPSAPQRVSDVEKLLSYFQRLRTLSGPALTKERDHARQASARTHSQFNRVRFAMILSLPGTSFSDEPQALELLDQVVRNRESPLHGIAYLLAAQLQEHRRLAGTVQGLQKKLDALKSLERTMSEREAGRPK